MRLTWDEFKKLVDAEIAAAGETSNLIIEYIDISGPTKPEEGKSDYKVPLVHVFDDDTMAIT